MKTLLLSLAACGSLLAFDIDEAVKAALENHASIAWRHAELGAAKQEVRAAESDWLPDVDLVYGYTRSNQSSLIAQKDDSYINATIAYNLFNRTIDSHLLRSAEATAEAQRYQEKATTADVVLQTRQAYLGWLEAIEAHKIAEEAVRLLEEQARTSKNFYLIGSIAKYEHLDVEVQLYRTRQQLLDAESTRRVAKARLERMIGGAVNEAAVLPERPTLDADPIALKRQMLSRRSELHYLQALARAQQERSGAYGTHYLPRVDTTLSYERVGDEVFPNGKPVFPTEQFKAGVTLSWNLFNGFESESLEEAARLRALGLEHQYHDTRRALELQLTESIAAYTLAVSSMEVTQKALEQAKEQYRIVNDRYEAGLADTRTLLDARLTLTEAQSGVNQNTFALYGAYVALIRVIEGETAQ